MMPVISRHSCDWCNKHRGRRRLRDLLQRFPEMTTAKAARRLEMYRAHVANLRSRMEAQGCVPTRTTTDVGQALVEKALEKAQRTGGRPIGGVDHFDPVLAAEFFGGKVLVDYGNQPRAPIGTVCYPGMRRAA